jgi:hypothetical protein
MDGIFRAELSKVVKYEIVQVSRTDMASLINREAVSSSEIIPSSVIAMLRQKYGADAVLFTDFTLLSLVAIRVQCNFLIQLLSFLH